MSNYWIKWPRPDCEYCKDLSWASNIAIKYLNNIKNVQTTKQKAVIFDIDDTIVFGDPEQIIGVKEMDLGSHNGQEIFILPVNNQIVKIVEYAKSLGMKIILLTARPPESELASMTNMSMFRVPYDMLIVNKKEADPCFKLNTRRVIANKFHIVLTVGDQITDVLCPGTAAILKLPDPDSKVSYFSY